MALRCAAGTAAAVLALAAPPAAAAPYSFSSAPTQQLAEPGWPVSAEVLPDGGLRTGYWELRLTVGGRPVRIADRVWERGYLPVLRGRGCRGGACVVVRYVYDTVGGRPALIVRLAASGHGEQRARFGAQLGSSFARVSRSGVFRQAGRHRFAAPVAATADGLYQQPGIEFSPGRRYSVVGPAVRRDGATLLVADGGRLSARAAPRADSVAAVVDSAGARALTLVLPVAPVAADPAAEAQMASTSAAAAAARAIERWRTRTAPAAGRLRIAEPKARNAALAGLVALMQARSRAQTSSAWIQHVNALQYRAFWLRDNAHITAAIDRLGLLATGAENLAFVGRWQAPDGQLTSRTGQLDGTGQALWALGEHARLTRDGAWAAAQVPLVTRAVDWIARVRAADPLGLLPPGDPRDDEFAAGHLTGDNAWALSGLRAAADLARLAGAPDLRAAATAQAEQLEAALRAAARTATARTRDRAVPASLDPATRSGALDGGSEGFDWGNYFLAWPDALPAADPLVRATAERARRRSAEGLVLWGRGNLHTYLGFPIAMARLRSGDPAAALRTYYAMLAHTDATHGAFETGVLPYRGRATHDNIAPHGTFAADLLMLSIALLVDDRADAVHLASALPPEWARAGARTTIGPIETRFGPVSLTVRGARSGATLRWSAPAGTPIVLERPSWARGAAGSVSASGSASWRWTRHPPRISFRSAATQLQAEYRRRGRTPPSGRP